MKQHQADLDTQTDIGSFNPLGLDVIQYIVSFLNAKSTIKPVCKTLRALVTNIERQPELLQQRVNAANKEKLCMRMVDKIKFNPNQNTIWTMKQEQSLTLNDLLMNEQCKNGDKILVYDGEYSLPSKAKLKCDLQFIGMGDNVRFTSSIGFIPSHRTLSFKNIQFIDHKNSGSYRLRMESYSNLLLQDCLIEFRFIGVQVDSSCSFYGKNCKFVGEGRARHAIELYSIADYVDVIGCIFAGECDGHCVNIRNDVTHFKDPYMDSFYGGDEESEESDDELCFVSKTFVELKCIANLFKNENGCVGVAYLSEDVSWELHEETAHKIKYTFDNNVLKYNTHSGWRYKQITERNVNHYEECM